VLDACSLRLLLTALVGWLSQRQQDGPPTGHGHHEKSKRANIHDRGSLHHRLKSLSEASAEKWDTTGARVDSTARPTNETLRGGCEASQLFSDDLLEDVAVERQVCDDLFNLLFSWRSDRNSRNSESPSPANCFFQRYNVCSLTPRGRQTSVTFSPPST
jgi:hypothetical protein